MTLHNPAASTYDIEHYLPHRPPMLFVDEVLEVVPHESLKARKVFPAELDVFKGHFPGHPVLPGVFTVEALAQAAALLVNISHDLSAEQTLFSFMSIETTRFRAPVLPNDIVELNVQQERARLDVYKFTAQAFVGDKRVAETGFAAKLIRKE